MKKLLQTMLVSAVMVTSGFAAQGMADLQDGGTVEKGGVIDFNRETLNLAEGKSLDVYGSLNGTGAINCGEGAKVNVYGTTYEEDGTNAEAIKTAAALETTITAVHALDKTNGGSISENVIVNPESALNKTDADLVRYAKELANTDLIYVANSDAKETKCIGGSDSVTEISANLANTEANISGLKPSSLVMENKLRFSGDNSGCTEGTVTIGSDEATAEVEYSASQAAFQTETTVEAGSKLTISDAAGVTLKKDLTVQGGSGGFALNDAEDQITMESVAAGQLIITGKLIVSEGATLTLGTEGAGGTGAVAESPSQYPKVMSWPIGSFSKELTELNKLYYNVTLDDGTTTVEIYYDEDSKRWNATYVEGEYYMVNSNGDGGIAIQSMMKTVKTLTADEVKNLVSTKKELILAYDDVFSFILT